MEPYFITVNKIQTAVYRSGKPGGEPLVFLHGGGLDSAMLSWKEVMEQMDGALELYAIDLPGYGRSDKPDIVYSIPMYADFLKAAFAQLGIARAHLAGLSMGGGIAIAFSLAYPQLVRTLTLVGSLGFYQRMPFHGLSRWFVNSRWNAKSYEWMKKNKKLMRWDIETTLFGDKSKVTDAFVDELFALLADPDGSRPWESFQRYEMGKDKMTTDLAPHLGELKMPVLIVNGEKDPGVPLRYAISANQSIPNSRLHVMKGCRHWAQKERPEEFAAVLKTFLSENGLSEL